MIINVYKSGVAIAAMAFVAGAVHAERLADLKKWTCIAQRIETYPGGNEVRPSKRHFRLLTNLEGDTIFSPSGEGVNYVPFDQKHPEWESGGFGKYTRMTSNGRWYYNFEVDDGSFESRKWADMPYVGLTEIREEGNCTARE